MRYALSAPLAVGLGLLASVSMAFAHSYCGKTSGVEQGGIPGSNVSITLSATSGGVPVANGATVTNGILVISGQLTAWKGKSAFCSDSRRICYWTGNPFCTTYDYAEIDNILIDTSWTMGCGSFYCSGITGSDPQYRSYSANIPLVAGSNKITVSGQNGYYYNLQVDCEDYGLGIACRLGKNAGAAWKSITVNYVAPTVTPTTDAADWQPGASWYPPVVAPSQSFQFAVPMKNCRTSGDCASLTTWSNGAGYALQTAATNASRWGIAQSTAVPGTVSPGSQQPFIFNATAPAAPGDYTLEPFRMFHGSLFGEATSPVTIRVNNRPVGGVGASTCEGGISGYAQNPETPDGKVQVIVYEAGAPVTAPFLADGAYTSPYAGHGWSWTPPVDNAEHAYEVRALDPDDSAWYPIGTVSVGCYDPPQVSLDVSSNDYCAGYAGFVIRWNYTSAARDIATYRVFVRDGGTIVYDTLVTAWPVNPPGSGLNVSGETRTLPDNLAYSTTYTVEAEVTDISGNSATDSMSVPTGTAWPSPRVSWTPEQIFAGVPVMFSGSVTAGEPITDWKWTFNDGSPQLSGKDVTHPGFPAEGAYTVILEATNAEGTCRTDAVSLESGKALPGYREVRPGEVPTTTPEAGESR